MKNKLKTLSALALAAPLTGCVQNKEEQPNIIFFLIDDMGWADCSVSFGDEIYPRNQIFHTPNLEKMAAQGMLFGSAYASSTSSKDVSGIFIILPSKFTTK